MCPHCNNPTPAGAAAAPYCCTGCKLAGALVRSAGLEHFYDLRGDRRLPALGARPAPTADRRWSRPFLQPLRQVAEALPGDIIRLRLDVQGLQCAACVWLLERLYARHRDDGALSLTVNPGVGSMELCYRRGSDVVERFLDDAERLGYRAGAPRKSADAPLDDLLLRFGLCAALAMNSMIFSFSQYFGLSPEGDAGLFRLFSWGSFALATAAVILGGCVFFRSASAALRRGVLHMDVPIALGIALSYLGSVASLLLSNGRAAYFDTVSTFIALMLLGRMLQRRLASHHRRLLLADDGVDGLLARTVSPAGRLQLVPAAAVEPGQALLCAPGELVPMRAELTSEQADFSLEWVSGESERTPFRRGQIVPAGAHNGCDHAVELRAVEPFYASQLSTLLAPPPAVGETEVAGPAARFWDRLGRGYVVAVLVLAAVGFLAWMGRSPWRALDVTVAILVVTCPCALGLATPLAYELAQGRLRRRGLFVRRPSFLDRALGVRKVLFDKTGTLTLGALVLDGPRQLAALDPAAQAALFQMVARSNHPMSRALLAALMALDGERLLTLPALTPELVVTESAGSGLTLRAADGTYRLGRPEFAAPAAADLAGRERTLVFSRDGKVLHEASFSEALCPDAAREIAALVAAGHEVSILSGDAPERAAAVGRRLGLPPERVHGGLSPADKRQLVEKLDGGRQDTLMVGDGINDAQAFAAAACAGTPAVDRPTLPARADFYFLGVGVGPIAEALATARQVRRVIRRNLLLAALYNGLALSLSFAGLMTPLRCAVAMPVSSLVILLATARSLRERPTAQAETARAMQATEEPAALAPFSLQPAREARP